jgi:predicted dithiol-disulfide oxidoreductase (DUF899 family)
MILCLKFGGIAMTTCESEIKQVAKLQKEIQEKRAELIEILKREQKLPVEDYVFQSHDGKKVKLSELFGDKSDLIVIHNMGARCPYCTMWADGFNGLYQHLADRAAFVVVSNDAVDAQQTFKQSRGWRFPMISSMGTDFFADLGFLHEESETSMYGRFSPGISTFKKHADGKIERVASRNFGPGDDYCVTWPMFDLLAEGTNGWEAKFSYADSKADKSCCSH